MQKLTINLIGAGHWGPNLVRTFSSLAGVKVHQVADVDPKRLEMLSSNFPGVTVTTDASSAIGDEHADAVGIITPVSTHFELAKAVLKANKHVFIEKPLCRTAAEADELIHLAQEKKRILMVGHIFIYNPGIIKVKQIIDSGELGRIIYLDAVRTNLGPIRNDVNALWDLASHDFAIFDYWLDSRARQISASGKRVSEQRLEDVVFATVSYESGPVAHVHASWLNPRKVRQITVVGEAKMVVWDDIDPAQTVQIYSHGVTIDRNDYDDTFGTHRLKYHTGDLLVPRVQGVEPLRVECQHFVDCLRTGAQPRTDAVSAKRVVEVLVAADKSMASASAFVQI